MKGVSELQLNKMATCVLRLGNLATLTEKRQFFLHQILGKQKELWQAELRKWQRSYPNKMKHMFLNMILTTAKYNEI
jgi:hypothetical protein